MSDKKRERKYDKEKYKKKQQKKKRRNIKKKAKQVSREKRKYVRKKIKPYYDSLRSFIDKHLLFVIRDTENMEKVLLQKNDLGNGVTLLTLPYINMEMIDKYLKILKSQNQTETGLIENNNEALNALIKYWFSVTSDEQKDLPQANMMVFRNCKIHQKRPNLIALNVRPYDLNTWFSEETTTVGNGTRVFKGKKLQTFFHIEGDLGNTYVFHDTITELLLYKAMMKKIDFRDLQADHFVLARKHFLNFFGPLYMVLASDDKQLYERFRDEGIEAVELDEI